MTVGAAMWPEASDPLLAGLVAEVMLTLQGLAAFAPVCRSWNAAARLPTTWSGKMVEIGRSDHLHIDLSCWFSSWTAALAIVYLEPQRHVFADFPNRERLQLRHPVSRRLGWPWGLVWTQVHAAGGPLWALMTEFPASAGMRVRLGKLPATGIWLGWTTAPTLGRFEDLHSPWGSCHWSLMLHVASATDFLGRSFPVYYSDGPAPRVRLMGGSKPAFCVVENDVLSLMYNFEDNTIKVETGVSSMTTDPLEVDFLAQEFRGARFVVYVVASGMETVLPDVFILPSLYPFC